ncbi:na+/H+ antiporter NhaC [Bacteroides sp. CAG:144]|nr:na+/H+ antiporter NhaC [Bacteroides sp. CAG:144]
MMKTALPQRPGFRALVPLFVFLGVYLLASVWVDDFYAVPITVAFIIASMVAVALTDGLSLPERIARFSEGAADKNILIMIWIFILAGAFAQSAKAMGAIDATVNLTLWLLPDHFLLVGLFAASCFISLSVGTIVALVPVAAGLADKTGIALPYMTAIVVGGAFFGDNLSFISDTTIAATRTQLCEMKDKFRVNILIVFPAAVVLLAYYTVVGFRLDIPAPEAAVEWVKVIPYIVVLLTALAGVHVMLVLTLGIFTSAAIGVFTGGYDIFGCLAAMGEGITGMGELIIVTLLAGGMLELIRYNGGMEYIISRLTAHVSTKRWAELSIAALVSLANLCTANNTIAIITTGPIARDITMRFGLDARKTASILDTFSCAVQGLIPYGAQLLIAAGLTQLSPLSIIRYLYYPVLLGLCALLAILIRYPRRYS